MRLSLVMLPLAIVAAPALAQPLPPPPPPPMGGWRDAPPPPPEFREQGDWGQGDWDRDGNRARADWLAECRHRIGARRSGGATGALVGAAVGGVAGNAIAGRGDKLAGTLIGAGAGAAVGLAIDRAVSRERRPGDYCEAWLDRYGHGSERPGYGYGYQQAAYGFAYQPMMVMVPVAAPMMMMQQPAPARRECREVVTYDTVVDYVPGPARRVVPPRARPHDKRVRIVPDKRVPAS